MDWTADEMRRAVEAEMQERLERSAARAKDHKTSRAAAKKLQLRGVRAQVYDILREHPEGLTQTETRLICEKRFGVRAESTYRKRIPELALMGLVYPTEQTRPNTLGNDEVVWRPLAGAPPE